MECIKFGVDIMKKTLFTITLITLSLFLFSDRVFAKELESIYWDSETGKMVSNIESGVFSGSGSFSKDGNGFNISDKSFTFNFNEKKDFTIDFSLNLKNSAKNFPAFSMKFDNNSSYPIVIYGSGNIGFFGISYNVDLSQVTDFPVHVEYDSKNSILKYSSSYDSQFSGSKEIDSILLNLNFSDKWGKSFYNSFSMKFGIQEEDPFTVYESVKKILGELPEELEILYLIFTVFIFIVLILCSITPFLLIYWVWR